MSTLGHPGDVIDSRFTLTNLLSIGSLATVWEALDATANYRCVIKLYAARETNPIAEQYTSHVASVSELLMDLESGHNGVVCSAATGRTDEYLYQAFPFVENASLLANLIQESGPMHPGVALRYLVQICKTLSILHGHHIVHADLKPANILMSHLDDRAFLIDLGMAELINNKRDLILIGTPKYLAPDIAQSAGRPREPASKRRRDPLEPEATTSITYARGRMVGPYVDIYSLAIIMLEMTTRGSAPPEIISGPTLVSRLQAENPEVAKCSAPLVRDLAELIATMLLVEPNAEWEVLEDILQTASKLLKPFGDPNLPSHAPGRSPATKYQRRPTLSKGAGEVTEAVFTLNALSNDLVERTAVFVEERGKLQSISHEPDLLLEKVGIVFDNALARSRNTWKIGMALTVACFVLISAMLVTAVILTILTGKASWALIFGGASVPLIIGTLIWKPYDLAFNATIRSQQIELIHIQIQTVFGATTVVAERVKSCQEAVASLQRLYAPTASPRSGSSSARRPSRKSRNLTADT